MSLSQALKRSKRKSSTTVATTTVAGEADLAPRTWADVAVHVKKKSDVRAFITNNVQCKRGLFGAKRKRMLVLSGPAGCGKSTMLRVLAQELRLDIVEWRELATKPFGQTARSDDGYLQPHESRMDTFRSFLLKVSRYKSLVHDGRQRIVVLDELPFIGQPAQLEQFQKTLLEVVRKGKWLVVVLVTTDNEGQSDVCSIVGETVLQHAQVGHIHCNPIAMGLLKTALKRLVRIAHIPPQVATDTAIETIARTCRGDIRSATSSLQWLARGRQGHQQEGGTRKKQKTTKKHANVSKEQGAHTTRKDEKSRTAASMDKRYSLFHSIGKVLYVSNSHADTKATPEDIVAVSELEPLRYTSFLQQNILPFVVRTFPECDHSIDEVAAMTRALSDADMMAQASMGKYGNSMSATPEEFASSIAIRGYWEAMAALQSDEPSFVEFRSGDCHDGTQPQTVRKKPKYVIQGPQCERLSRFLRNKEQQLSLDPLFHAELDRRRDVLFTERIPYRAVIRRTQYGTWSHYSRALETHDVLHPKCLTTRWGRVGNTGAHLHSEPQQKDHQHLALLQEIQNE